jgi:hypothetical protein
VGLITYLGILLTFGVVFPPLAVVMCATMLSVAWQTKLSIGRFLHFAREQSAPQLAEAIDRDCRGAASLVLLHKSIFLIMCFACCFYALFLFDTLGDAVGLSGAYWVLIVMPLFPVALMAAFRAKQLCEKADSEAGRAGPTEDAVAVEMAVRATLAGKLHDVELQSEAQSDSVDEGAVTFNVLQSP